MQFGFMAGKGSTGPIFILRQRQEKVLEGNRSRYMAFVDLEKAYDRVPRDLVVWCLRKRGVTEKLVKVVTSLYRQCYTKVACGEGESETVGIQVGLHQGPVLSPFLFAVVINTISITVRRGLPTELLYADDLAITAESKEELEERLQSWQRALEAKGLKVNCRKTEVLVSCKGVPEQVQVEDSHGSELEQVDKFCYLGSTVEQGGGCREEVTARIKRAWSKWREVSRIVCDKRMALRLKVEIYTSVIQPVLLYGLEVLPLRRAEERMLECAEMRMLRWLSGISLYEHRTNEDIRRFLKVRKITARAREARLRWHGHVMRREEEEILKTV